MVRFQVEHQRSLFGRENKLTFCSNFTDIQRTHLDATSWFDFSRGWVSSGHETLFQDLKLSMPWQRQQRRMYDHTVEVPRLFCMPDPATWEHPSVRRMAEALSDHYKWTFKHISFALYRSGQDSVAYHRDRELRDRPSSLVAIVSLGGPRTFRLRPFKADPSFEKNSSNSIGMSVGWGDLLVMGGACQRNWEHAVPKVSRASPRMAVMFR